MTFGAKIFFRGSAPPPRAPGQDRTLGRVQGVLGGAAVHQYGACRWKVVTDPVHAELIVTYARLSLVSHFVTVW